jgi:phage shock protein A
MVGVGERVKSFFGQMPSIEKNVDEYLSNNFSSLIKAYKLARKKDLEDTFVEFEKREGQVDELSKWRDKTKPKVADLDNRIERLETKHGVKK